MLGWLTGDKECEALKESRGSLAAAVPVALGLAVLAEDDLRGASSALSVSLSLGSCSCPNLHAVLLSHCLAMPQATPLQQAAHFMACL